MSTITFIIDLLLPEVVQRSVGNSWDDAFARYVPKLFRLNSLQDWTFEIARFVNHLTKEATGQQALPEHLAATRGASILTRGVNPSQSQMLRLYRAARDGVDSDQSILMQRMQICQGLKEEAIQSYITDILIRHCPADNPAMQEHIVRELFRELQPLLGRFKTDTDFTNPTYYASQADSMIKRYSRHLSEMTRSL